MSRSIEDLHPYVRPICKMHIDTARLYGLNPVCYFTYRTNEEQNLLYAQGRDDAGNVIDRSKVVTNAKGGQSWHNITRNGTPASLAYDILITDGSGNALPDDNVGWVKLGVIGMDLGMTWGFINKNGTRWDLGHFTLNNGGVLTLAMANDGIDPKPRFV